MKLQALEFVSDVDVRQFIQGLDKTKYPEIARFIWLRYLEDMLESWSEEVLEETAKEIEQEVQRYGKDLPPDVAKLIFLLLAKSETNSEKYNKYRKWLSESSNPESRAFLQALDPDTKPEDENSVPEEISNERKEKWRMWGQLDNAMSQDIQAMSKREKLERTRPAEPLAHSEKHRRHQKEILSSNCQPAAVAAGKHQR